MLSLWNLLFCTYIQLELVIFHVLHNHVWLVITVLENACLHCVIGRGTLMERDGVRCYNTEGED